MIIKTFSKAIKGLGKGNTGNTTLRTERDLPMQVVLAGSLVIALIIWILPSIPVNFVGGLLIVVFGFFFATVSSRMVGIVGSSNNPISGMIIATLLISTGILKASGITGYQGMASAICIGTIVSIVSAMAGDTSQDLKTGYIIGATPVKQQIGEILGAVISALAIAGIMYLLNSAWGFGSPELPAPQGTLMKLVVEGVMGGTLPWGLIFCGMGVAVVLEILRLPVLPFAVGLYLPIYLSTPIYIGGIIRWITEKFFFKDNPEKNRLCVDKGVLYCSGMIAGEGIIGILLAVFAVIPFKGGSLLSFIDLGIPLGNWGSVLFFIIIIASIFFFSIKQKNKNSQ